MMIQNDELNTLFDASKVREVADGAFEEHNRMSVAVAINTAANCGEKTCTYSNFISESILKELRDEKHYVVEENPSSVTLQYIISWK